MKEREYDFEALAESTNTDWNTGRGELNAALKSIREQSPELVSMSLAHEIQTRAGLYRQVFENIALTPTALAKHWKRVFEEGKRVSGVNLHANQACATCDGDRMVVYAIRDEEGEKVDEYAPCPDCNPSDASFWRWDRTKFTPPDPAQVRERMRR